MYKGFAADRAISPSKGSFFMSYSGFQSPYNSTWGEIKDMERKNLEIWGLNIKI